MWRERLRTKRYGAYYGRHPSVRNSRLIAKLAKLAFLGVIGFFVLSFVVFPLFAFNLPSPDKIVRREGFSTKILDRNGEVLYDIYQDQKRIPVKFEDVPDYLKQATISIEDKNFYKHEGFDILGMIGGFWR